jgi:hypothetical protein
MNESEKKPRQYDWIIKLAEEISANKNIDDKLKEVTISSAVQFMNNDRPRPYPKS